MKYVYLFNEYKESDIVNKLGKKGTYLSEITNLDLPVPSGFVITTDACNQYYKDDQKISNEILEQLNEYIIKLEQLTGKTFGSIDNPLLIAIKCSSKNETPNLMNTILNVGLTEEIVENLSNNTKDYFWIWECYLNFIKDYSKNIMGVDLECFEYVNTILKNKSELTKEELRILSNKLKEEYKLITKTEFTDNSLKQLHSIIDFAFKSWNNQRANIYREDTNIPFTDGLAICIQSMIFGNKNKRCGTGTIYTRDPITGDKVFIGNFSKQSLNTYVNINMNYEFLNSKFDIEFQKEYEQLKDICVLLENHYKDMLKINFVVDNNKLLITQVCKGKKTAIAALKITCDLIDEQKTNNLAEQNNILTKVKSFDKK